MPSIEVLKKNNYEYRWSTIKYKQKSFYILEI